VSNERSVLMPQLGESVHEARIVRWLVGVGDSVNDFDSLVEIETDKVTAEVPAPFPGVVLRLLVSVGATVAVGAEIAVFAVTSKELGDRKPAYQDQPTNAVANFQAGPGTDSEKPMRTVSEQRLESDAGQDPNPRVTSVPADEMEKIRSFISPAVRRLAKRSGAPLDSVRGTGTGGRIKKIDLVNHLAGKQDLRTGAAADTINTPVPSPVQPDNSGSSLRRGDRFAPHSRLRKQIADKMVQSKSTIPHAWQTQEVDMSRIVAARSAQKEAFRERTGHDLTYLPYVVKAAGAAMRANPQVNSTYTSDGLILHQDVNIAISVALEDGVMLPVLRTVDGMSLGGVATEIGELTARTRAGKLTPQDVGGASLTVNNSGTFGTLLSYSVIPLGQIGILTMEVVRVRPVVLDGMLKFKPMMYLCFSLDHRVMDGLGASRFLTACREWLEGYPDATATSDEV
jgi:2-oxoisovalerate dehydrogenase E2 component (dihydrolipoyl transacylase)